MEKYYYCSLAAVHVSFIYITYFCETVPDFYQLTTLLLYVPVNNFSVMSWCFPVFMVWTSTKQRIRCLAQGHTTVPPLSIELGLLLAIKWIPNLVWSYFGQDCLVQLVEIQIDNLTSIDGGLLSDAGKSMNMQSMG